MNSEIETLYALYGTQLALGVTGNTSRLLAGLLQYIDEKLEADDELSEELDDVYSMLHSYGVHGVSPFGAEEDHGGERSAASIDDMVSRWAEDLSQGPEATEPEYNIEPEKREGNDDNN